MSYLIPVDAPMAQFIVVRIHSEYEYSVDLFVTEEAARAFAAEKSKQSETCLAKLLEI